MSRPPVSMKLSLLRRLNLTTQLELEVVENGEKTQHMDDRVISREYIFRTFVNKLESKKVLQLDLVGINMNRLLVEYMEHATPFRIDRITYDKSTLPNVVDMFVSRSPGGVHVLKHPDDQGRLETNWRDIPDLVQEHVLGNLSFKEKMMFRGVARYEKGLIQQKKHKFKMVKCFGSGPSSSRLTEISMEDFTSDPVFSTTIPTQNRAYYTRYERDAKVKSLLLSIFRYGEIDHLLISYLCFPCLGTPDKLVEELAGSRSHLRFRRFTGYYEDSGFLHQFLEKGLRADVFDFSGSGISLVPRILRDPLTQKTILDAKELHTNVSNNVPVDRIIEKWIREDVSLDKKLVMTFNGVGGDTLEQKVYDDFRTQYSNRIISKSKGYIRISTNNVEKHILFKIHQFKPFDADDDEDADVNDDGVIQIDDEWNDYTRHVAIWLVIPASLRETSYPSENGFVYRLYL